MQGHTSLSITFSSTSFTLLDVSHAESGGGGGPPEGTQHADDEDARELQQVCVCCVEVSLHPGAAIQGWSRSLCWLQKPASDVALCGILRALDLNTRVTFVNHEPHQRRLLLSVPGCKVSVNPACVCVLLALLPLSAIEGAVRRRDGGREDTGRRGDTHPGVYPPPDVGSCGDD